MGGINIIVHGFGGEPGDIQYLADYLVKNDVNISIVSLAGHGGTKKELWATTYEDWIGSVRDEVEKHLAAASKVNLIGFSMGGLISANLAAMLPVDKIVLINSPIFVWNLKIILMDIFKGDREKIAYYMASSKKTGAKPALEFLKLLSKTKGVLGEVKASSLILQCTADETVRHKSAAYLKKKLGEKASLKYYEGGCHQVFLRAEDLRDEVCGDVARFVLFNHA